MPILESDQVACNIQLVYRAGLACCCCCCRHCCWFRQIGLANIRSRTILFWISRRYFGYALLPWRRARFCCCWVLLLTILLLVLLVQQHKYTKSLAGSY